MPPGVTRDLIVVDNGSTDPTREVVEAFRARASFPVTYHREDREGHSVALNSGCRVATGDVIVFTDDDAFPDRGWLAAIHDSFVRRQADWVYGPVAPRWQSTPPPRWYGPFTSQLVACQDRGPEEFIANHYSQHFFGVNHACRRDKLFELGLYREDLGLLPGGQGFAGNDDELFYRALNAGCRLVYNPRVLVHHLIAPARNLKATHRANTRRAARHQAANLFNSTPASQAFLGIPRFYYRKPFVHLAGWLRGAVTLDPSRRFYHELQLTRFLTIIGCALRARGRAGRRAAPLSPTPMAPSGEKALVASGKEGAA